MSDALTELAISLKTGLQKILPGASAHERMRAVPLSRLKPSFRFNEPPRPGAVLILFYEEGNLVKFPLIKRPPYDGIHGGQVSLPGGKIEDDEDPVDAALREGWEEIGVGVESIEVIGHLSTFHIIPSNYLVYPVIGICRKKPTFIPDRHEVERILVADLSIITNDDAIVEREILVGGVYKLRAPAFDVEGEVVWGATAMILNELREIIRSDKEA